VFIDSIVVSVIATTVIESYSERELSKLIYYDLWAACIYGFWLINSENSIKINKFLGPVKGYTVKS